MFNFDTAAAKKEKAQKRKEFAKVKKWVEDDLAAKLQGQSADMSQVRVEVSEVQCGDPSCSPIDTVIRIWFPQTEEVLGLPMEANEIVESDIAEVVPPADVIIDWYNGKDRMWPPPPEMNFEEPRFPVGTSVECCIAAGVWAPGTVVAHHYTQPNFPPGMVAPYQIRLDDQRLIFAPRDIDTCIRLPQA